MKHTIATPPEKAKPNPSTNRNNLRRVQTLTIWPSGDCSGGYAPNPNYEDPNPATPDEDEDCGVYSNFSRVGLEQEVERWRLLALHLEATGRPNQAFIAYEHMTRAAKALSGLSDALNSHKITAEAPEPKPQKERGRRGSGGITPHGKRMLRSGAVLLAQDWDKRLITFATCTVPAFSSETMERIREDWGELTRQFQQELRRELVRNNLPLDYFGCSEVQPKRWEESGEIAPHLHFVFPGRRNRYESWRINHEWVSTTWNRILANFAGEPFDGRATTEARAVRKSIRNEIGKYLSKGGQIIQEIEEAGLGEELPTAYWNMPLSLRRRIKSLIIRDRGEFAYEFAKHRLSLSRLGWAKTREICVELPSDCSGRSRTIRAGYTGWITDAGWRVIEEFGISGFTQLMQTVGV